MAARRIFRQRGHRGIISVPEREDNKAWISFLNTRPDNVRRAAEVGLLPRKALVGPACLIRPTPKSRTTVMILSGPGKPPNFFPEIVGVIPIIVKKSGAV